jgi:hypothetical protein
MLELYAVCTRILYANNRLRYAMAS